MYNFTLQLTLHSKNKLADEPIITLIIVEDKLPKGSASKTINYEEFANSEAQP